MVKMPKKPTKGFIAPGSPLHPVKGASPRTGASSAPLMKGLPKTPHTPAGSGGAGKPPSSPSTPPSGGASPESEREKRIKKIEESLASLGVEIDTEAGREKGFLERVGERYNRWPVWKKITFGASAVALAALGGSGLLAGAAIAKAMSYAGYFLMGVSRIGAGLGFFARRFQSFRKASVATFRGRNPGLAAALASIGYAGAGIVGMKLLAGWSSDAIDTLSNNSAVQSFVDRIKGVFGVKPDPAGVGPGSNIDALKGAGIYQDPENLNPVQRAILEHNMSGAGGGATDPSAPAGGAGGAGGHVAPPGSPAGSHGGAGGSAGPSAPAGTPSSPSSPSGAAGAAGVAGSDPTNVAPDPFQPSRPLSPYDTDGPLYHPGDDGSLPDVSKPFSPEEIRGGMQELLDKGVRNIAVGEQFTDATSRGAIDTFANLKAQLAETYPNAVNRPSGVISHIISSDPVDLAKEYGFYKPEEIKESAMLLKGAKLGVNDNGWLVFEEPNGTMFVLDNGESKYLFSGDMFDYKGGK